MVDVKARCLSTVCVFRDKQQHSLTLWTLLCLDGLRSVLGRIFGIAQVKVKDGCRGGREQFQWRSIKEQEYKDGRFALYRI